ncbi:MAG: hypothetical protein AMJ65_02895 [Phycisphaerae bacterium SG8_4]|nr:MAG: hypothetical protein AMJ65_02895 [Phycisphaerae bacterium SG8_4]
MARIIFGFDELLEILVCNSLLPRTIARLRVKGERIHFVIKTNSFILPFIPASVKYLRFEGDLAIFELAIAGNRADRAKGWFKQMLEVKMPSWMKLEYPVLSIDVGKLLTEKSIRGIRLKEISFRDSEFTLITDRA